MIHPDPSSLLLLAGASLAACGIAWRRLRRSRDRRQVRRRLEATLGAGDAAMRSAAIAAAGAQGVAAFADLLLHCAATETDATVIATLAATVARQQWEPMDSPAVVKLRLWAHRHQPGALAVPAETPRRMLSVVSPPVEPAVPAAAVSGVSALRSTGSEHGRATLPAPPIPRSPAAPVRRDDAGVRGGTIIVTGAGGPAGVAVIRALARHGVQVVGADADGLAAGLRLADEGAVIPRAEDPGYVAGLVALAERSHATALICTVAEEMAALSQAEPQLREAGLATWIPSPAALEACLDKWRFARVMQEAGVNVPETALDRVGRVPGPWIVKPRFGRGSRDVYPADDSRDLAWALGRVDQPIVQTRVTGREFTVDALVDPDGRMVGAVARWRLETKAGISTKGRTFSDETLTGQTAQVLTAVGITGAANVQGFIDEAGTITFIEVNPRFSGGLPLSIAAGADLVGEYLRGVLGLAMRPERLIYRSGMTMIRHFEEVFES